VAIAESTEATNVKVVCDRWPDASSEKDFGESSARIMGATTNEEKALAVWRFIQQFTVVTTEVPQERALGNEYMADAVKLLNIYGGHWCDGLSRIMQQVWRSMGYRAEKFYKFGHTLADCHWEDEDGVERWHVFDLSQHWYVYDRTGQYIASPEELALDHSLQKRPSQTPIPVQNSIIWPSYVHAPHIPLSEHKTLPDLRVNENLELLFGNTGAPYYDIDLILYGPAEGSGGKDFEHGPYEKTYGNGIWEYSPDLSRSSYSEGLYSPPQNLLTKEDDGLSPNLHPSSTGVTGTAILKIQTPHIISDCWIDGTFYRKGPQDMIRVSISTDEGSTWKAVWEADTTGSIELNNLNFCEKFNIYSDPPGGLISPFGRYEYLLKLEISASNQVTDCGVDELKINTVTQHNLFSLPQLWPGRNQLTVTGEIADDTSLRVTYNWSDEMGSERVNIAIIEETPYTYEIITAGDVWEDVVCNSIKIEVIPRIGSGNYIEVKEDEPSTITTLTPQEVFETKRIVGHSYPPALKSTNEYITIIQDALAAQEGKLTDSPDVANQWKVIEDSLFCLAELRNPSAKDVLIDVIYKDRSNTIWNKQRACQTLYLSVGEGAVPTLIKVLQKDPSIQWGGKDDWEDEEIWLHTSTIAAAILANINNTEARNGADYVAQLLDTSNWGISPGMVWQNEEIRWGFIRQLGRLGGPEHASILLEYLKGNVDASANAARALGRIGNRTVLPDLSDELEAHDYSIQDVYIIEAIGKLGEPSHGAQLYKFLSYEDEDYRGFAATALGELGDVNAVPHLQNVLETETFPWVIKAAQRSLTSLSGGDPPSPPVNLRVLQKTITQS
jgi:hypothetical protein